MGHVYSTCPMVQCHNKEIKTFLINNVASCDGTGLGGKGRRISNLNNSLAVYNAIYNIMLIKSVTKIIIQNKGLGP